MMIQDDKLLRKCLKEIGSVLNWVDSKQWQHKHFESLSELIFEKTKVSLSPLTLKRLWGKIKYDSAPSVTTLDTLARFLEYKDWIDYQNNQEAKKNSLKFRYLKSKWALIISSLVLGILLLSISLAELPSLLSSKNYSDFEFSIQKLSTEVPNTVYFKYDVRNTEADSVIIKQSWDPKLHHLVDKDKTDFSCIYYYPGYYKAKLVLDKEVVAEEDLYIKSNGLLGIIHKEPVPVYLTKAQIVDGNKLSINEKHLVDAGFDLQNEIPYTTINLVEEFDGIQGDNFELQAVLKQTYPKGDAICQKSGLLIMCSESYYYIPFSIKGCVNELRMHIPDKEISAKDTDLSDLGIEGTANVRIKVSGTKFQMNLNEGAEINDTLSTEPGRIVGLLFAFHGTGELNSFKLSSGNKVFSELDYLP